MIICFQFWLGHERGAACCLETVKRSTAVSVPRGPATRETVSLYLPGAFQVMRSDLQIGEAASGYQGMPLALGYRCIPSQWEVPLASRTFRLPKMRLIVRGIVPVCRQAARGSEVTGGGLEAFCTQG